MGRRPSSDIRECFVAALDARLTPGESATGIHLSPSHLGCGLVLVKREAVAGGQTLRENGG